MILRDLAVRAWTRLRPGDKHRAELAYWRERWRAEGGTLRNEWYEGVMLAMLGEPPEHVNGKIVADFGCGPRGTLCWATQARERIGIDALVDAYLNLGIRAHPMTYVRSTERIIPLPSGYVDVLFTLNALDHVLYLDEICAELLRILAPGGELVGSFNLFEPRTRTEPQSLTPELLERHLLGRLSVSARRIHRRGPPEDPYGALLRGRPEPASIDRGHAHVLWARAAKAG